MPLQPPKCCACSGSLEGFFDVVSNGVNFWHRQCYNCSSCKNNLFSKPKDVAFLGRQPICFDCFAKHNYPCAGCNQSFAPGSTKILCSDKHWHETCLRCDVCKKSVESATQLARFNDKEGNFGVMCQTCLQTQQPIKCAHCEKSIRNGGTMYNNSPYHTKCITKIENQPEIMEFFHQGPEPETEDDMVQSDSTELLTLGDKQYHVNCFLCQRCNTSLVDRQVVRVGGKLYCSECNQMDHDNATEA